MAEVTVIIAFLAGLSSFLSPCILPLIPAFLAHLAGTRWESSNSWTIFWHSLMFVIGFSLIFSLLGVLLNLLLSNIAYDALIWLQRAAGVMIILFSFHILGLIHPRILERAHRLNVPKLKNKSAMSFALGSAFAIGWTPCVSAILASVLLLAVSEPSQSFIMLASYSLGLGIPFLLAGSFTGQFIKMFKRNERLTKFFNKAAGIVLLILGVLVFTGKLSAISSLALFAFG